MAETSFVENPSALLPEIPKESRWSPTLAIALVALTIFALTATVCILQLHSADYFIVHLLNSLARRSFVFDYTVRTLERDMFSNLLVLTLAWFVWFKHEEVMTRTGLLIGVITAFLSGILSRGLQLALPTHLRPLHDPAIHFIVPYSVNPFSLNHWSSYPSDHAAVLFGIAMAIFLADRKIGTLAFACATVTNLVRIYLGFHYPSDILGGAMLGIFLVATTYSLRGRPSFQRLADVSPARRPVFYAAAFYICFGIVTLFTDVRDTASGFLHGLHHHPTAEQRDTPDSTGTLTD
jgi:membrane-associated phospholipid phosphatase